MDLRSDADLIMAARSGDAGSFGVLYERHAGAALIVARQYTSGKAEAEDAVADAFAAVWSALRGGSGPTDAFRAYLMFLGPWDQGAPFNTDGISGLYRWVNRVWTLLLDHWDDGEAAPSDGATALALQKLTHRTIKKVDEDIQGFRFNTMLAALMEFTNQIVKPEMVALKGTAVWKHALESLVLMMAPSVPHVAEELWERTGHGYSVHQQAFPSFDEALTVDAEVTLVVQVKDRKSTRLNSSHT